jgi:hypothetical protein
LSKLRIKKTNTGQKHSTEPHNDERVVSKKTIEHQVPKSTVVKTKRSLFSSSGTGNHNGMVKRFVTGTLHFVFLASSIIIILFVPPTRYNSNAKQISLRTHNDDLRSKSNDFNDTITPASVEV